MSKNFIPIILSIFLGTILTVTIVVVTGMFDNGLITVFSLLFSMQINVFCFIKGLKQ